MEAMSCSGLLGPSIAACSYIYSSSSSVMGVYGSPHKRLVESCEIWHTHWGQSPGPIHKVSRLIPGHSSATNGSKLDLCLHTQHLNRMSDCQKLGSDGFLGSSRVQRTPWRQFPVLSKPFESLLLLQFLSNLRQKYQR